MKNKRLLKFIARPLKEDNPSSDSNDDPTSLFKDLLQLDKPVSAEKQQENVQPTGKQIIRCRSRLNWKIVKRDIAIANADTLVELSLYCVKVASDEISLPNLKRLTIFYNYDIHDNPKIPKINLKCLTKLETFVMSYFNESVINCLKQNSNLKVLKLGYPLRNADRTFIADQMFNEYLPFQLKELILEEDYDEGNFTKFLATQMSTLNRLKIIEASVEQIALILNNSKIVDLCLMCIGGCDSDDFYLEELKALVLKPNRHILKLNIDVIDQNDIIKFICLHAPNVKTIDIFDIDRDWVEFAAKNLKHLQLLTTHFDERVFDDEGNDYPLFDDDDDEDEDDEPNPSEHYKNIIKLAGNAKINKNIKFRNCTDGDFRNCNEYSLNVPWRRR